MNRRMGTTTLRPDRDDRAANPPGPPSKIPQGIG